jgi:hypothetical protein
VARFVEGPSAVAESEQAMAMAVQAYERRSGAARAPLPSFYRRREPEATVLHAAVREHLATFLVEAEERSPTGLGLPRFVREEFERYLRCGILAHGFARVHCGACGRDLLVAFSCKNRGICPSCSARRMYDTAIHLTERVLPHVPVRQWSCRCRAGHAGPWLGTRAESVAPSMRRSRPSSRSSGVAPVGRASGAATVALFRSFRDLATL